MLVFLISHLQELNGAVRNDSSRHNEFTAGSGTLRYLRHGNKEHNIMQSDSLRYIYKMATSLTFFVFMLRRSQNANHSALGTTNIQSPSLLRAIGTEYKQINAIESREILFESELMN